MFRYVRYAAPGFFVLLAIALIVLWVRSYYWWEIAGVGRVRFFSYYGLTTLEVSDDGFGPLNWAALPADDNEADRFWRAGFLGISFKRDELGGSLSLPHWFLAACSLGLAAPFAFKRSWRYSLRTILVATTLLAAILGLAVRLV